MTQRQLKMYEIIERAYTDALHLVEDCETAHALSIIKKTKEGNIKVTGIYQIALTAILDSMLKDER